MYSLNEQPYEYSEYWWEWDDFHQKWNYMTGDWTVYHGKWVWVYAIFNHNDFSWDWYSSSSEYHNNVEYDVIRWMDKFTGNMVMGWYEYDENNNNYNWCEKHTPYTHDVVSNIFGDFEYNESLQEYVCV